MKTLKRLTYPSVMAIFFTFGTTFLTLVSCKQPSNFEGGDKIEMHPVALEQPSSSGVVVPPPPPTPAEIEKLDMADGTKRYKLEDSNENTEPQTDPATPQKVEITERKVIKTGDIRFKTADLNKTRQTIMSTVNALKGYVNEESQTGDGNYSEMHITVRIPAPYFDSLMTIVSSNAEYFDAKNIRTQDVTEEYIDVMTRIKAKKLLESQYFTILKGAKSIKEIMEVKRELNTIREEIESTEGRMRYLSSQVAYSTLTLAFYKDVTGRVGSPRGFWSRLGDGLVGGWQTLLDILIGFVAAWPVWLILGGVFFAFRRFWILRKKSKETPQ